ncbi:molybdate ABC transporter substrate-binding protein [Dermatophilus congolensis]|uniref:molybdate ABC transporter substrate-binding protein n=1 Tax=Dermatophilus congolensis TaxID=1863 RepID=UPI0018D538F2|nr:molybdate ABC transporter substrate-binding protein [Dermatophilus congolensis]
MVKARWLIGGVVVAMCMAGCGGAVVESDGSSGVVTVFAAASLKESFTHIGEEFSRTHPGVQVRFNFGPSSGLAQQIEAGAPADVFASASPVPMEQVRGAGLVDEPVSFARNSLRIAVPVDSAGQVGKVEDLGRADVKVALCEQSVPCGVLAAKVLEKASVDVQPVTREVDVKAVVTKVILGEVDAGLVYGTDVVAAAGKIKGVEIPEQMNAWTSYPLAVVRRAQNGPAAQAFVQSVRGEMGKKILTSAGFGAP